jgi:hypothetical protein
MIISEKFASALWALTGLNGRSLHMSQNPFQDNFRADDDHDLELKMPCRRVLSGY